MKGWIEEREWVEQAVSVFGEVEALWREGKTARLVFIRDFAPRYRARVQPYRGKRLNPRITVVSRSAPKPPGKPVVVTAVLPPQIAVYHLLELIEALAKLTRSASLYMPTEAAKQILIALRSTYGAREWRMKTREHYTEFTIELEVIPLEVNP